MKTLALVMIVKNEERCLGKCLKAVKDLVDKIYITDTGSADRTVEIAESYGAIVSHYEWEQDFSAARNFSLAQSDCDWNLVLDADEYLIKGTRRDLEAFLEDTEHIGAIERKDYYAENTDDGEQQISFMYTFASRLLPKGVKFTGRIHEQEDSAYPVAAVPLLFDHDGYLQGGKNERNLAILLEEAEERPENPYMLFQIAKTLKNLERCDEARTYFEAFYRHVPLRGAGYRPGGIRLYLECLMALQDYDAALSLAEREKVRLDAYADFHFTCGILFMKAILADTAQYIRFLPQTEQSYLKCLTIGEVPLHQGTAGCGSFKAAYNLGTWYEASGNMPKATECYGMAAKQNYTPAIKRLEQLK